MTTIYLAGPLFTQAEWLWNAQLADELRRRGFAIILPQEGAWPMIEGSEPFDARTIFDRNVASIAQADVVLAVLDQADPDSGTCWECGYAHALGKPVVGLRTDIRPGGDDPARPINLMLSRSCVDLVVAPLDKRDDLRWVADAIATSIRDAMPADSQGAK